MRWEQHLPCAVFAQAQHEIRSLPRKRNAAMPRPSLRGRHAEMLLPLAGKATRSGGVPLRYGIAPGCWEKWFQGVPLPRARANARGRVLRFSRSCKGRHPRRCGGFLRSPPRCSWLHGPSCAGLPLRPLTRVHSHPTSIGACSDEYLLLNFGPLQIIHPGPSHRLFVIYATAAYFVADERIHR